MAGLSGKQVVVDVVAASERLVPSAVPEPPAEPAVSLERASGEPADVAPPEAQPCMFGHPNLPGAMFCGACGVRMDATKAGPAGRPAPAHELDEAARAERERQHAAALAAAAKFEQAPERILPSSGQTVLIHFIDDGLTAFGRVWYRGQELEIGPDHPRWGEAVGWIMLSRFEQLERWGKHYFDYGPWPGRRSYAEEAGSFEQLKILGGDGTITGPSEEQLRQADLAEARRGRGVPAPAFR